MGQDVQVSGSPGTAKLYTPQDGQGAPFLSTTFKQGKFRWVVCLMLRCTKEELSVGTFGEMQVESQSCLAPTFNRHWIEHLILSGSHQAPTRPNTGVKRLPKGFQDQGYEIVQPGSKYANPSIVTERKMLCCVLFVLFVCYLNLPHLYDRF